jgi:hypothetical protein
MVAGTWGFGHCVERSDEIAATSECAMHTFLPALSLLIGWFIASALGRAAACGALDVPPTNLLARRYRAVAFCCFMIFAALLLTASLVDTIAKARPLSEVIGFSGLACFLICTICLLRSAIVNKAKKCDDWVEL